MGIRVEAHLHFSPSYLSVKFFMLDNLAGAAL
jgi:hypothetical protein